MNSIVPQALGNFVVVYSVECVRRISLMTLVMWCRCCSMRTKNSWCTVVLLWSMIAPMQYESALHRPMHSVD